MWCVDISREGSFQIQNRLDEHHGLKHGLEHGKMEKKTKSKNFFASDFFLSKKVHVMFLHVLEVFLVCFSRSACRERRRREHGSISNGSFSNGSIFTISCFLAYRVFWRYQTKSVAYYVHNKPARWAYQVVLRRS